MCVCVCVCVAVCVCVFFLKSFNAIYLIILYFMEYYLTPGGRLVDRLPICMSG